ncbi:hypothetical protein [Roseiconus lacunae]|uniref:hypothetical protein n=1 Tax=Roseiconus lacunae TaxID=2605694 RepID=UPI001E35548F|nr:hypothetical protein [Roseiconus lacunae]MCD0459935.1 hypothetical protein [Roseiconus lacunae]
MIASGTNENIHDEESAATARVADSEKIQAAKWLLDILCPIDVPTEIDLGDDDRKKRIKHPSAQALINDHRKHHQVDAFGRDITKAPSTWTLSRILDHINGRAVGFATNDIRNDEGLIKVDVDSSSRDEAEEFAHFVNKTYFDGRLYHEPSTGGVGRHGYLLIHWGVSRRSKRRKVMRLLRRLESWLNAVAQEEGFDVHVDICGEPTEVKRDERGNITAIEFGRFMKLPRCPWAAKNTLRLDLKQLAKVIDDNAVEVTAIETPCNEDDQPERKSRGSFQVRKNISRKMVDANLPIGEWVVQFLNPSAKGNARNITAEHVAEWLALQQFFAANPNADGSNPVARARAMWEACHADGTFRRAYVPSISAAIRNCLSDANLILWESNEFRPGFGPEKGQAMRWQIDRIAIENLSELIHTIIPAVMDGRIDNEEEPTAIQRAIDSASRELGGNLGDSMSRSPAHGALIRPIRVRKQITREPDPPPYSIAA